MDLILHHIGVLVKDISWVASFYTDSLRYQRASDLFHDPLQTAHGQFFRLKQDSVCLELVSPDGADSKLNIALSKGGGLNHLCFSTRNIEKTCIELRSRGLFPVSRPVSAVAFGGRRIAWFVGKDRVPLELVEQGEQDQL